MITRVYVVYVKVKISKLKNIIKEEIKSLKEQGYPWDPLEPGDPSYDTSYLCPNGGDLAGTGLSNLDNTNSVYHVFEYVCGALSKTYPPMMLNRNPIPCVNDDTNSSVRVLNIEWLLLFIRAYLSLVRPRQEQQIHLKRSRSGGTRAGATSDILPQSIHLIDTFLNFGPLLIIS